MRNDSRLIDKWLSFYFKLSGVANRVITVRGEVMAVQVPESLVEELVKGK